MKQKNLEIQRAILVAKRVKKQIKKYLNTLPGKTLSVKRYKTKVSYFCYEDGEQKFISKGNTDAIKALEEKNYYTHLNRINEQNLLILCRAEKLLERLTPIDRVFSTIPKEKRHLIKPFRLEDPITKKLLETYGPGTEYDNQAIKNDRFKTRTRETNSGYLVRSKSEVEISDEITRRGIPFLYEYRLQLKTKDGYTITAYPDFTFYNPATEKFIFLEHFGKVDDPVYAAENFPKLATYLDCGLVLNKDLFITTEGENHRFTKSTIERVLDMIEKEL